MKPSELLATPDKWTQGVLARDAMGAQCREDSPEACCWCLIGALMKCLPDDQYMTTENTLSRRIGGIPQWNDTPGRTHAEVLALLKGVGL